MSTSQPPVDRSAQLAAMRARADEMMTQFHSLRAKAEDVTSEARAVTGSATSEDGFVTATCSSQGELLDLDLDPRIYRSTDADALAATVLATTRAAAAEAQKKVRGLLATIVPRDTVDDVLSGDMNRILKSVDGMLEEQGSERC